MRPRSDVRRSADTRRTQRIHSDENLRVRVIDLDATSGKREVAYPAVPLILVAGQLEPAPSWWLLDLVKRRTSTDTVETYSKGVALWFGALHQNRTTWGEVDARTAQQFVDALVRRGNSASTVSTRMAAVLAFYRWSVANRFLPAMPFGPQALIIPKAHVAAVEAHSKGEFERIVANLPRVGPGARRRDELICEAGRFLGLRRKEIVGLTRDQFDALDLELPINVIWTDPAHTKGRKRRAVLVPRLFVVKIRSYIATYRQRAIDRRRVQHPTWTPSAYLFLTEKGTPVAEGYITDTWKRAAKAAGVESRFHNNRSSLATHVADVSMELGRHPLPIVKDILGHAHEATSDRYVTHSKLRNRLLMEAHIINDLYRQELDPE